MRMKLSILLLLAAPTVACVPDFDTESTLVTSPRIVAIRSVPAEAREGEAVELEALVADPEESGVEPSFSLCLARKPLTELGPVNPACLVRGADESVLEPLGRGARVSATIPATACASFGPERPEPKPGEPAGRPVDPDASGGFYLPVVAFLGSDVTLGASRLRCDLAGIPRSATVELNQRYRSNENPAVEALELVRADGSSVTLSDGDDAVTVERGERVTLRVRWSECPSQSECGDGVCGAREDTATCEADCVTPTGCNGAERYAVYDAESQRVVERVEALFVSYLASGGTFDEERSDARAGERFAQNGWRAPAQAGTVRLWGVLRDDRGGSGFVSARVQVE